MTLALAALSVHSKLDNKLTISVKQVHIVDECNMFQMLVSNGCEHMLNTARSTNVPLVPV